MGDGDDRTRATPTVELPFAMTSVRTARRFVADVLAGEVPDDVLADLVLATSELVTNAIEHGAQSTVRVSVDVGPRAADVVVHSAGDRSAIAGVEDWEMAEPTTLSGRGLGIVRSVSEVVDVAQLDGHVQIVVRRTFGDGHTR